LFRKEGANKIVVVMDQFVCSGVRGALVPMQGDHRSCKGPAPVRCGAEACKP